MGMQLHIETPSPPAWPEVASRLTERGFAAQMRMIDGELALPDEAPPGAWSELRVAAAGTMVTIRRNGDAFTVVAFDNLADDGLRFFHATAWALAAAGQGRVHWQGQPLDADQFAAAAGLDGEDA